MITILRLIKYYLRRNKTPEYSRKRNIKDTFESVIEYTKPTPFQIYTKCPGKWVVIDIERGEVYRLDNSRPTNPRFERISQHNGQWSIRHAYRVLSKYYIEAKWKSNTTNIELSSGVDKNN